MKMIVPAKEYPVYGEFDVCVIGGGTAGTCAAFAAAREGLNVLIVEQFGSLGGSSTMGLVLPVMGTGIAGNPQSSSIGPVINQMLADRGYNKKIDKNTGFHDSLYLRFILDELCKQYDVKVLFNAFFTDCIKDDGRIKGILVSMKGGPQIILAKRFIDATGDADVAVSFGCPYEKGNPKTGKCQPTSLRYMLGGIDIPAFQQYICEIAGIPFSYSYPNFYTDCCKRKKNAVLWQVFKQAVEAGDLDQEDFEYWQVFSIPGREDGLAFNCPEFFVHNDGTDPDDISFSHLEGRRRILRHLEFYKKYFRGFDKAYVAEVSEMLGVRESRRIKAEYVLTAEDVVRYRKFSDYICQSNYPVDIHGAGNDYLCKILESDERDSVPFYEVPYLCLVPKECENLLVAGRCAGFDFVAQSSIRVIHSCRAMGEAAGIACKLSIDKNLSMKNVSGKEIREKMISYGADFASDKGE